MLKSIMLLAGAGFAASLALTAPPAAAQPRGSYMESCRRVRENGPTLFAECRDMNGDWRPTSIDLRACRAGIANTDGELTCGGQAYPVGRDEYRRPPPPPGYGAPY